MRTLLHLGFAAVIVYGCANADPEPVAMKAAGVADAFPSVNRPDVMGTTGAVVSDHPLATAAGYEVLRRGGNAVDAAITMAAVLAVVRPHMNGVGGDAFGLFYVASTGAVEALNASGRAGREVDADFFRDLGIDQIPERGPLSVTVPGAVAGWEEALRRYGTISLAEALAPATRYADEGFPVSARLRADILDAADVLNDTARDLYLPGGDAPAAGMLLRNPALAETLRQIAHGGAVAFYEGAIGARLAEFVEAGGGHLRPGDFRSHTVDWTEPIGIDYLGHRVLAFPPNTQGVTQLQQMRLAEEFDLAGMGHNSAEYLHTMIEIKKLAFADRNQWIADPDMVSVPVEALLDEAYAAERAKLISSTSVAASFQTGLPVAPPVAQAGPGGPPIQGDGDTVYLTTVDRWGNAVSWLQSLFLSFGSGMLEPSTGIVLHNRGSQFRLEPGHPNAFQPGKRPFHTLTPLIVLRGGRLAMTLGTPGGDGQTQSLLQIYHNLFLFGMRPQEAVEAVRYRSDDGARVLLEARAPAEVQQALAALGHELEVLTGWSSVFGGAQMILIHPESGALIAAADPRREAYAIAY